MLFWMNLANAASAAMFVQARVCLELLLRSSLVSAIFESDLSVLRLLGYFISLQHVHDLILRIRYLCCGRTTSKFSSALRIDSNQIRLIISFSLFLPLSLVFYILKQQNIFTCNRYFLFFTVLNFIFICNTWNYLRKILKEFCRQEFNLIITF